jgi:RNA polymerase sigma factor (sigma-70 family)
MATPGRDAGMVPRPAGDAPGDAELVRQVLAGEVDRFGELVRRHQDALHRLAWSMVFDTDVASDVVQDTFIRAYANLGHCRHPDRFRVWLLSMLRNRCLDHLKSRWERHVPLDHEFGELQDRGSDALEVLSARTELERALEILPGTLREAFMLRHVEDMSYEDMADVLGTTVAAAKMRVSRARDTLRTELGSGPAEVPVRRAVT